jgi:hypothetical protein
VIVPAERAPDDLGVPVHALAPVGDLAHASRAVEAALAQLAPDLWVTDTFPLGPAGELERIALPRAVLLARAHREGRSERFVAAARRYAKVLDLEAHLAWRSPALEAEELAPFVRTDVAEDGAADVLFVADDPELASLLSRLAEGLGARGVRTALAAGARLRIDGCDAPLAPSPLLRLRPRAVVGPAGFNLTYEANLLGVHHLAIPRARRFDDQALRADAMAERVRSPTELALRLEEILARPVSSRAPIARDAQAAASRVLDLVC